MKDNYPPGAANDPDAPYNRVDIEDTADFNEKHLEVWNERIMDINEYMLESFTEASDEDLTLLARLIRDNQNKTHTEAIGELVTRLVINYCKPSDDEIADILNDELNMTTGE